MRPRLRSAGPGAGPAGGAALVSSGRRRGEGAKGRGLWAGGESGSGLVKTRGSSCSAGLASVF